MMNIEKADITGIDAAMTADVDAAMKQYGFTLADKWILSKMNDLVQEVTDNMENLSLVSQYQSCTISCGRSSVTGISRW